MKINIHTIQYWIYLDNKLPIEGGGSVPYRCICCVYVYICMTLSRYILVHISSSTSSSLRFSLSALLDVTGVTGMSG